MSRTMMKLLQVPYTFLLMNWAVVAGLYYFVRGHEGFWDLEHGLGAGARTRSIDALPRLRHQ